MQNNLISSTGYTEILSRFLDKYSFISNSVYLLKHMMWMNIPNTKNYFPSGNTMVLRRLPLLSYKAMAIPGGTLNNGQTKGKAYE